MSSRRPLLRLFLTGNHRRLRLQWCDERWTWTRTCVYEDVDEAVLKWIHTRREKNVPISRPFVTEKALQFGIRPSSR
ncbi:hypothetical protein TNCV_3937421 [Trichonephila clavipes]|nr:hypothetical protein TNCV_3937421 [Trichonephila clavipes]